MLKKQIDSRIYFIDNFISENVFNKITEFILNNKNFANPDSKHDRNNKRKRIFADFQELNFFWDEFNLKLSKLFDYKKYKLLMGKNIIVWEKENIFDSSDNKYAMDLHSDDLGFKNFWQQFKDEKNTIIPFSGTYYLNDNFLGGELYFDKKNILIKPKKNMLIVHPGEELYSHGIKKIHENDRFSISFFLLDKKYDPGFNNYF